MLSLRVLQHASLLDLVLFDQPAGGEVSELRLVSMKLGRREFRNSVS
jgi:hypothetical protein